MQSGLGQPAAHARQAGIHRRYDGIGVLLLLGLAVFGCIAQRLDRRFTETRRVTIALESIDGLPTRFPHCEELKDEAGARRWRWCASEANYGLRGYLAAHARGRHR